MPEKSIFPEGQEFDPIDGPHLICSVKVFSTVLGFTATFERLVGERPFTIRDRTTTESIYQDRTYRNVKGASRRRLHKVVSKLVNDGDATINLGDYGYEAEL